MKKETRSKRKPSEKRYDHHLAALLDDLATIQVHLQSVRKEWRQAKAGAYRIIKRHYQGILDTGYPEFQKWVKSQGKNTVDEWLDEAFEPYMITLCDDWRALRKAIAAGMTQTEYQNMVPVVFLGQKRRREQASAVRTVIPPAPETRNIPPEQYAERWKARAIALATELREVRRLLGEFKRENALMRKRIKQLQRILRQPLTT